MIRLATRDQLLPASQVVIAEMLPDGYPSIASVASAIGVSVRTLQRRLEQSGASYRLLVDEVRLELARRDLLDPRTRMADIATRLGYRDASSFSRAFVRWTGKTPRQYRQQMLTARGSVGNTGLTDHP